jgi:hypothetical protein
MTEKLLHYLWQFQYFDKSNLRTEDGEEITIIFPGTINTNQGPDFSDARIKIGNTLLAGSVELHINASDWQNHGHQADKNYNKVILHVVFNNDDVINNGISVLELQQRIPKLLLEKYADFMKASAFIPCAASIGGVKDLIWYSWKERLVAERLTRKANNVLLILKQTNDHREETFWRLLANNFGIKVNSSAFQSIAENISITILARHKNNLLQLEALLFGTGDLLNDDFTDEYPKQLKNEYSFLKSKYGLISSHYPLHFLRMRIRLPGLILSKTGAELSRTIQI